MQYSNRKYLIKFVWYSSKVLVFLLEKLKKVLGGAWEIFFLIFPSFSRLSHL